MAGRPDARPAAVAVRAVVDEAPPAWRSQLHAKADRLNSEPCRSTTSAVLADATPGGRLSPCSRGGSTLATAEPASRAARRRNLRDRGPWLRGGYPSPRAERQPSPPLRQRRGRPCAPRQIHTSEVAAMPASRTQPHGLQPRDRAGPRRGHGDPHTEMPLSGWFREPAQGRGADPNSAPDPGAIVRPSGLTSQERCTPRQPQSSNSGADERNEQMSGLTAGMGRDQEPSERHDDSARQPWSQPGSEARQITNRAASERPRCELTSELETDLSRGRRDAALRCAANPSLVLTAVVSTAAADIKTAARK